jgi:hypothetical protein
MASTGEGCGNDGPSGYDTCGAGDSRHRKHRKSLRLWIAQTSPEGQGIARSLDHQRHFIGIARVLRRESDSCGWKIAPGQLSFDCQSRGTLPAGPGTGCETG